ncbi:hypothetical protein F5B22DRAFT_546077 [Xylaria bambusicola]|uniref:uncharacterized protein n=1 Tax=Xylaria bambusicola TaxID=326684 RepID=UPI002007E9C4|nr:uncharacterized protein F5B22DRAFT_546077 [Xylaria bambusicola]KAI0521657.1 hypothetical protein F5B22DRAFT_546077 [Xylaria bambusicola]
MPNSIGVKYGASSLQAVVILALLTLADNILTNALPIALGPGLPQTPGFWNLTTTALILSVVSDLIGQPILAYTAYHYNFRHAITLNILSIATAAVFSLVSSFWWTNGLAWTFAIASAFKIIGSGSHATIFLTIIGIRDKTSGSLRTCLIYTTGAVVVLSQTIAASVGPFLATQSLVLPYIFSIICCFLAAFVVNVYVTAEDLANGCEWASDACTQPLLSPPVASYDASSVIPLGMIRTYSNRWQSKPSTTRRVLKLLGLVFLLAAIAKATRPLFITYIQHRVGITPSEASSLWLIRTIMSLVTFSTFLPTVVTLWSKNPSRPTGTLNLYIAKISIVLLSLGAILIGVARTRPVLVSGLVINTLGVATDLALLSFAADAVPESIASFFFMTIASIESAGTLIGIAVLYPLYQMFLDDNTLLGGIPYYVCGVRIPVPSFTHVLN